MRHALRTFLYLIVISIFILSCDTTKKSATTEVNKQASVEVDTIKIENDELEYQVIILEIGFESWLVTQKPRNYYSLIFLESKNMYYVTEYNMRAIAPGRNNSNLYPMPIDYDPNIEYGMEVNYLLYMYFKFFEQKYNQRLI